MSSEHSQTVCQQMNTKRAAAYLGIAPAYLQKLLKRNFGPVFSRIGEKGEYRFEVSDLEAWKKSNRRERG